MVTKEDDSDLLKRMKRLEGLIAILLTSDTDAGGGEREYLVERFLSSRASDEDHFDFLLRGLFNRPISDPRRRRHGGLQLLRRDVLEISKKMSQLSESTEKTLSLANSFSSLDHKDSFASKLEKLSDKLSIISEEMEEVKREVHEKFLIDTMELNGARVRQTRFIPVRVYISEDDPQTVLKVEKAALNLVKNLGFLTATEFPPEKGSWFRKWISKSFDALTSDEVKDVMKKGKRAVELATIDKKRAEVNKENAIAAAEFIKAIENIPKAVAQFGSLLIIKRCGADSESNIFTRVLSEQEMELIENNQEIMKDANHVLDKLAIIKIDKDTTIRIDSDDGV